MLLGVRKRFVFIATPGLGRATGHVETQLRPIAEIERTGPRRGPIPYDRVLKTYDFVFDRRGQGAGTYFKFAVMRDPVERVAALFRARRSKLPEGCTLAEFWTRLQPELRRSDGTVIAQRDWFTGPKGKIALDHIIPHADLDAHLARIADGLALPGVPPPLPAGPALPGITDAGLRAEIETVFEADCALYARLDRHTAFDHPALTAAPRKIRKGGAKRPQVVIEGPRDAPLPGAPDYLFLFMPNNSGSTVMAQYLASQSSGYLPPFGNNEGQHIPQARPFMKANPWSPATPRNWRRIREIWEAYREGRTFIEASPPNLVRVAEIHAAFGDDARFFFSICDPYQQIASTLYNYTRPPLDIAAGAVDQWVRKARAVRDGRAAHPDSPFLSYEDFCDDPGRMNAALGLDLVRPIRIAGKQNTKLTEIRNASGRTCAFLSAAEIDRVRADLAPHADLMAQFGYTLRSGAELLEAVSPADLAAGRARRAAWTENGGKIRLHQKG